MAALAAGAALSGGHYEGQHAAGPGPGPEDWSTDIGSMDLEAERGYGGWQPAPPVDPEPWRVQTMADLAPLPEVVLPDAGGWISGPCIDPGPGEAPSDPGPDQDPRPFLTTTPGTRVTIYSDGEVEFTDPPARHSDLGPQARAVLARYERRFHELWACPWLDLGGLT